MSDNTKIKEKTNSKHELWQALKFLLFSISAGVIQIVSFTILQELIIRDTGSDYGWSYFISLVLSVLWNFTFNRKFTFKSANNVPKAMTLVFLYYLVFTPLSIWWGIALERVGWNEYIILAMTMIINFVSEFLYQKFVVFRGSIDSAVDSDDEKNFKKIMDTLKDK